VDLKFPVELQIYVSKLISCALARERHLAHLPSERI